MSTRPQSSSYEKDLYGALQVTPRASFEVIDAAHRALLKIHAPRLHGADETMAKAIAEAHVILSSETERRKYDDYRLQKTKTLGPYRIVQQIAEGGFGKTYKAEHIELGEYSCLKHCNEISDDAEMILKEETRSIWNLRHYGLPIMRDLFKHSDGSYVLAMSWIEGPTLQEVIEKHGRIDAENIAWVAERLLNTLSYLHHHGVVHGDIKPQNIIVQETAHLAILVDFGLSAVKPTSATMSKGHTAFFSPPEQVKGMTPIPENDFYSLGMTMLYALSGDLQAARRKQVPQDVPEPFCEFIRKMVIRNPLERPKRADLLFTELKDVRLESFKRDHSGMKKFA